MSVRVATSTGLATVGAGGWGDRVTSVEEQAMGYLVVALPAPQPRPAPELLQAHLAAPLGHHQPGARPQHLRLHRLGLLGPLNVQRGAQQGGGGRGRRGGQGREQEVRQAAEGWGQGEGGEEGGALEEQAGAQGGAGGEQGGGGGEGELEAQHVGEGL